MLNDAELVGIATSRPNTLAELARCKGVGPIRLERWGDELLAALDGADEDEAAPRPTWPRASRDNLRQEDLPRLQEESHTHGGRTCPQIPPYSPGPSAPH